MLVHQQYVPHLYNTGFSFKDYTTRTPEILSRKHQIISREDMEQYIKDNELVEYDKTDGYYSGTSIKQIKVVMQAGKTCLLHLQPQVCVSIQQIMCARILAKRYIYRRVSCFTVLESY